MTSDTQSKDGFRTIDPKRPTTNSDWYDPDITLDLIPIQTLPVLESTTGLEGQELVDHINASVSHSPSTYRSSHISTT